MMHTALHGWGRDPYSAIGRFWYGTPAWFKAAGVSTLGHRYLMAEGEW